VGSAGWSFQHYAGTYEPIPQIPRGWYVLSGYAAQRQADNAPGSQTPQSAELDVAAMFFSSPVACGGFGGYLVSDANTNWLLTSRQKVTAGYPISVVAATNQGKLFATASTNLAFAQVYSNVFSSTSLSGYPGMEGAPLFVQADDGNYYTAGVYLGPSPLTNQFLVRALDAQSADLINRGELSGSSRLSVPLMDRLHPRDSSVMTSNVNPLSFSAYLTQVMPGIWELLPATIEVDTGPLAATTAGGWQLGPNDCVKPGDCPHHGLHDTEDVFTTETAMLQFVCLDNYGLPLKNNTTTSVASGQTCIVTAPYLNPPASPSRVTIMISGASPVVTLFGVPTYTYSLDSSSTLTGPWTPMVTNVLSSSSLPIRDTSPRAGTRFYRARWVTCPNQ
jgi:hypothetical protein